MSDLKLTGEQTKCLDSFATGERVKIIAGAGAGKTSTLRAMAKSTRRRGLYLVFNKQAAAGCGMPPNVKARTSHSLAFGAIVCRSELIKSIYDNSKRNKLTAKMAAAGVGLTHPLSIGRVSVPVNTVAYYLMDWVSKFSSSSKLEVGLNTAPSEPIAQWLATPGEPTAPPHIIKSVQEMLLPMAAKLWSKMSDFSDPFPCTHDTYLKLWAMTNPILDKYDFILYDETQDANPVTLNVVVKQPAQQIYVGDPNQQIYGWRGAVNAMDHIKSAHECTLSQSFRFGPKIAEYANLALDLCESDLRIVGAGAGDRNHGDAILCRTNAGVISQMAAYPDLSRVHIAGGSGTAINLLSAMGELRATNKTAHPELINFQSWVDFIAYTEEQAGELTTLIKMTDGGRRVEYLKDQLLKTAGSSADADITLSTAHKAKGLEWSNVTIHDDFTLPSDDGWSQEEARLLYVAFTRPMARLTMSETMEAEVRAGLNPEKAQVVEYKTAAPSMYPEMA